MTHPVAHLVYALVVVGLVQAFFVKLYFVPSGSMEPTLSAGDRILVNRISLLWDPPSTGDVVVFDAGPEWGEEMVEPSLLDQARFVFGAVTGFGPAAPHTLVKRIIATEGQTVSCCDSAGRVVVDEVAIDEPYVASDYPWEFGRLDCESEPVSLRCFAAIVVPEGRMVALGDHRDASRDSVFTCRGRPVAEATDCAAFALDENVIGRVIQ